MCVCAYIYIYIYIYIHIYTHIHTHTQLFARRVPRPRRARRHLQRVGPRRSSRLRSSSSLTSWALVRRGRTRRPQLAYRPRRTRRARPLGSTSLGSASSLRPSALVGPVVIFNVDGEAFRSSSSSSSSAPFWVSRGPFWASREAKGAPREPQESPRGYQEGPKAAQGSPKRIPREPREPFRGSRGRFGSNSSTFLFKTIENTCVLT